MPKVSVITPNYNHARYLPKRIESILNQTYQDFELIILDDASTDNSREIIEPYTSEPRVRAIFNTENSGSAFRQWNLGLSHAQGEYIWIAESDDYADASFLEILVDRLDQHPNVGLAFCQSWGVEADGTLFDYLGIRYHVLSSHWNEDYVNSGADECINYLFWHNMIPNASAVLLRRSAVERVGGAPADMFICGDWITYINILSFSDIAFVSAHLNYFRHHQSTSRGRFSQQGVPARETQRVQQVLIERYSRRSLVRNHGMVLPEYVCDLINGARRPPYFKVPPGESLALLAWFARIHPRAFWIAFRTFSWELVAHLSYRVGLLGIARRMKNALTSGRESKGSPQLVKGDGEGVARL
jgi:glycosyltransferase involved in cell wall biosynthesis